MKIVLAVCMLVAGFLWIGSSLLLLLRGEYSDHWIPPLMAWMGVVLVYNGFNELEP